MLPISKVKEMIAEYPYIALWNTSTSMFGGRLTIARLAPGVERRGRSNMYKQGEIELLETFNTNTRGVSDEILETIKEMVEPELIRRMKEVL